MDVLADTFKHANWTVLAIGPFTGDWKKII